MDDLTRLFLAARDGDDGALEEAIRQSQPDVWRFAAHLIGPADADDVTQDTFLRGWRALPAYRGESSARTWLLSITRRAAADAIRRRQRGRRIARRAEAAAAVASSVTGFDERFELDELLQTLDDDQRAAFVLTQVIGCSYAETAQVCGVRIGTVRSRVSRARGALVDVARASESESGTAADVG